MNKEPTDFTTVSFCYFDQWRNQTSLTQTLESDYCDMSELEIINESYKNFLNACGFYTEGMKIMLVDDEY